MDDETRKNHVKSLCPDGTVTWAAVQLNGLSSETTPRELALRFKVEPFSDNVPPERKAEFTWYSVPFKVVSKTISGEKAGKERAAPSGPTEHAQQQKEKRELSRKAAQAVHEGRFGGKIATALKDPEFKGASHFYQLDTSPPSLLLLSPTTRAAPCSAYDNTRRNPTLCIPQPCYPSPSHTSYAHPTMPSCLYHNLHNI